MNPEKFNLDNYLSKNYKSWPNIEKTAKTDLDFLNDLSNDTNSIPTKINELSHLTYNKEAENQIITKTQQTNEKNKLTRKNLSCLPTTFCLAQKMGEGLGWSLNLFQILQQQASSTTARTKPTGEPEKYGAG